ncbi:MAG: ComF family protein [Parasporobacterium sp.]|nr:ComF family protein [Parasporobacterium sp.]
MIRKTDMPEGFIKEMTERASELLFPRVCPLCGRILKSLRKGDNPYICASCYKKISFPEGPRCLKCSRPVENDSDELCSSCRRTRKYFDRGAAVMMHDEAARKILYDLKYSNKRDNADMAALEAADRLHEVIRAWNPQVMIPVPLHRKREFERGYNQAELLALKTSGFLKKRGISIPVDSRYLKRVRNTAPQKELGLSDRQENIRGSFGMDSGAAGKKYTRVMLVDDIYTSGATLSECASVLRENGTEEIYFLAFSIG